MALMAARSVEYFTVNSRHTVETKASELMMQRNIQKQRSVALIGGGLELVAMAKRASEVVAIKRLPSTDPEFVVAINALNTLKHFPVPSDSLRFNRVVKCLESLTNHPMLKIRAEAANALLVWKKKKSAPPLEPSGKCRFPTKKPPLVVANQKTAAPICPKPEIRKKAEEAPNSNQTTDEFRDKIRGHLLEALSKVVTEAQNESAKAKAKAYDPVKIASSIESTMYKKMGKSSMAKYRSILFNLKDPKNPELRRRVLLGEIKPESLVEMTTEEMASSKRKRENEEIRLKRLNRMQGH